MPHSSPWTPSEDAKVQQLQQHKNQSLQKQMANALGKHRFVVDSEEQGMREAWRVSLALPFYGGGGHLTRWQMGTSRGLAVFQKWLLGLQRKEWVTDKGNCGHCPSHPLERRTLTANNSQAPQRGGGCCRCSSCSLGAALALAEGAGSPFLSRELRRTVCLFTLIY